MSVKAPSPSQRGIDLGSRAPGAIAELGTAVATTSTRGQGAPGGMGRRFGNDEGDVEALGRLLLGVLTPPVIAGRGGDIGVSDTVSGVAVPHWQGHTSARLGGRRGGGWRWPGSSDRRVRSGRPGCAGSGPRARACSRRSCRRHRSVGGRWCREPPSGSAGNRG
jgi:hypothetical protein